MSSPPQPKLLLIGDSHIGIISRILDKFGVKYSGGEITGGNQWADKLFESDPTYFLKMLEPDSDALWRQAYHDFLADGDPTGKVILTDIGMHTHTHIGEGNGVFSYLKQRHGDGVSPDLPGDLRDFLVERRWGHIAAIAGFVRAGYKVVVFTDPPFFPHKQLLSLIDELMCSTYRHHGCVTFNARHWLARRGGSVREFLPKLPKDASSRDCWWLHAEPPYYVELTKELLSLCGIPVTEAVE